MERSKDNRHILATEEPIDLRAIVNKLLQGWYLFVIFGLLGLGAGYLYNHYSTSAYQVKATLFVPPQAVNVELGFEGLLPKELTENQSEVYNQIEILKSYYLHHQVAERLNWRTVWYRRECLSWENLLGRKDPFHWVSYYKDEPFRVEEPREAGNPTGIRLYVDPLPGNRYRLTADFEITRGGKKEAVEMDARGTFGEPFVNDFFHFTLIPTSLPGSGQHCRYSFVFNDLRQVAGGYRSKLSVGLNDKESELICLRMGGKNPHREMDYLNELIAVYMENKVRFQTATQYQSLRFIEQQLSGISDSLQRAKDNFTDFQAQNQLIDISRQGTQVLTTLQQVESEQNNNRLQMDYFDNLMAYLNQATGQDQMISPSVVGIRDASFNKMVLQLGELFSKRQVTSFSAREDNPTLKMIDEEIARLTASLKENLGSLIHNAQVQQQSLDEQHREILAELDKLPGKEQELINYKRRLELNDKTNTYLLHRKAEIEIALAGATSEVRVIDAARPETTYLTGLSSRSKLMMGLLSGLAFPGLLLLGGFFLSNTIVREEDITHHTLLPIIGNVQHSRMGTDTPVKDYPNSGIAEAYRILRTNLQYMLAEPGRNIIAIHSINPGEGKSFTSVNMATILAMNNKKVLLVGCDMRKPKLHKTLRCSNEHGLSTYLSRQDELQDIIVESDVENLWVIPAGPVPPNPTELLDRPGMRELISTLGSRYDYVLLDNAPIAYVSDGLLAGRLADLNIIILRYGQSKKEQLHYINQLGADHILDKIALLVNDISGAGFGVGNYYSPYSYDNGGYYQEPQEPKRGIREVFGKKKRVRVEG